MDRNLVSYVFNGYLPTSVPAMTLRGSGLIPREALLRRPDTREKRDDVRNHRGQGRSHVIGPMQIKGRQARLRHRLNHFSPCSYSATPYRRCIISTTGRRIEVGQKASRTLTFTEKEVMRYAEITGDHNPLHFDEKFAASTKFGRLVVHGGLTAGILNAIVAEDLPGPGTVFMSQNLKYLAPVYIGDTILGEVEVMEVHPTKPVTKLSATVRNQGGDLVLEGECWCYTLIPS